MSGSVPPPVPGDGRNGAVTGGLRLAGQITTMLGPQLTTLVILNVLVLGGLGWFVNARAQHTARMLEDTSHQLTACLQRGAP